MSQIQKRTVVLFFMIRFYFVAFPLFYIMFFVHYTHIFRLVYYTKSQQSYAGQQPRTLQQPYTNQQPHASVIPYTNKKGWKNEMKPASFFTTRK